MKHFHVSVLVGSLREGSLNQRLADGMIQLAPPHLGFGQVSIADLPPYDQDDDPHPSPAVRELKARIEASDAVLFVTPEYNRSIPGVLKNAIDHGSRPYGESAWAKKPAGILGVSIGAAGTAMAQQHLRNVLAYLDMPTLGQPEAFLQIRDDMFDDAGSIGAGSRDLLQGWMDAFAAWIANVRFRELSPAEPSAR